MVEHRFRAVAEVLDGSPVVEVALRYGTSRQSVHNWLRRYREGGREALADRSRRPHSSPTKIPAEIEAMICQLRRAYPTWGARRIAHELALRGIESAPNRSTVHRILSRNGLVRAQAQNHRRVYRRWQRDAPMQLWQMDIMGGIFLASGRECKLVTGIDDHSRFIVIAKVVAQPSGRAVCAAFVEAMQRYGVPAEMLTDNGKQFTGRYSKPRPTEVMFERVCRENGITQRLTKPRSPTTTGKIERFHKTLRREMLDDVGAFADLETAQRAVDVWVDAYNRTRPHQALDMNTPASVFRPHQLDRAQPRTVVPAATDLEREVATAPTAAAPTAPARHAPLLPVPDEPGPDEKIHAVEFETVVTGGRRIGLPGTDTVRLAEAWIGRTVTVWVSREVVHVLCEGHLVRSKDVTFTDADMEWLRMRGARPAGPEPAAGLNPAQPPPAGAVIEVDRKVAKNNGIATIGAVKLHLGPALAGKEVTLRFDGNLMHVIAGGLLVQTLPAPIPHHRRAKIQGARTATSPLPPSRAPQVIRKVSGEGTIGLAGKVLRVGRAYEGKMVTVLIEQHRIRVLDGDTELITHPWDGSKVTQYRPAKRAKRREPSNES